MTVNELAKACCLKELWLPDGERRIGGAYAGDLLSWVMGRAKADDAFVTIMTNINVVAVASLADVACVIFAENVAVSEEVLEAAKQKEINLLRSKAPIFESCVAIGRCLE